MAKLVRCRDLGINCDYEALGETVSDVLEGIMKHIQVDHDMDWFEIEDVHMTALGCVRERAA